MPETVRAELDLEPHVSIEPIGDLPARPPRLCGRCPHCDTFRALVEAVRPWDSPMLLSDIGFYTLGALPPFNAVSSYVDMGASISMAVGAAKAGAFPVVCTIGDSTFHGDRSEHSAACVGEARLAAIEAVGGGRCARRCQRRTSPPPAINGGLPCAPK